MKRITNREQFIEKAKEIHGDKYDYSEVEYTNAHTKVKIFCNKCKKYFYQNPGNHIHNKQGCMECGKVKCSLANKMSFDEFVIKAKHIHGNKYEYDQNSYVDCSSKIKIRCKRCNNIFEQIPSSHLQGKGCRKCASIDRGKRRRMSHEEFMTNVKKTDLLTLFDFEEAIYVNAKTKIKLKCKKCGYEFYRTPRIVYKTGCPECNKKLIRYNQSDTISFIEKAKKLHGNMCDYSEVKYINNHTKVKIYCNKCKKYFYQTPAAHLVSANGCPNCKSSKGEKYIEIFLRNNKIVYEIQKKFNDCRDNRPLPFDFYLPSYNTCIEFQGKQHYEEGFEFFKCVYKNEEKAEKAFKILQLHDAIKKQYCLDHNIKLLEIRYDENVDEKLIDFLKLQEG